MDALRDSGKGLLDALLRAVVTLDGQLVVQRLATASAVPLLASFVWHYSCTVVEVTDDEQSRWLQHWLSQQTHALRRVRRLLFVTAGSLVGSRIPRGPSRMWGMDGQNEDDDMEVGGRFSPPKLVETPSRGASVWTWFGWYPVSIEHRSQGTLSLDGLGVMKAPSTYAVTVWFAPNGADIAKKLLLQGRLLWQHRRASKTEILMVQEDFHPVRFTVLTRPSRPLSSVILDGNKKEQLLTDATQFLQGEKWYVCKGIPYRRGYLLYGDPGCGKSSLVTALAGELRLPIVLVPLNSKQMSDESLLDTLSASPKNSIILIEDVDCAFGSRDNNKHPPSGAIRYNGQVYVSPGQGRRSDCVTLSGLLNALDGVAAQEGRLVFMTTNHRDQLDRALVRPGRVDVELCLENASKPGAAELFDQFYGNTVPGARSFDSEEISTARTAFLEEVEGGVHSYAKLQGVLMDARDDPSHAAKLMRAVAMDAVTTDKKEEKPDVVEGTCHIGVCCNGCDENPIFGGRYKCQVCHGFDLCSACYEKQVHKVHPFMHLPTAVSAPMMLAAQQDASGVSGEKDSVAKVDVEPLDCK